MTDAMPRFMTASEYRQRCFAGKPPTLRTIIAQVDRGELPGYRAGRRVYVDVGRIEASLGLPSTGDAGLDRQADTLADHLIGG